LFGLKTVAIEVGMQFSVNCIQGYQKHFNWGKITHRIGRKFDLTGELSSFCISRSILEQKGNSDPGLVISCPDTLSPKNPGYFTAQIIFNELHKDYSNGRSCKSI
jgi:hypothetical protein